MSNPSLSMRGAVCCVHLDSAGRHTPTHSICRGLLALDKRPLVLRYTSSPHCDYARSRNHEFFCFGFLKIFSFLMRVLICVAQNNESVDDGVLMSLG